MHTAIRIRYPRRFIRESIRIFDIRRISDILYSNSISEQNIRIRIRYPKKSGYPKIPSEPVFTIFESGSGRIFSEPYYIPSCRPSCVLRLRPRLVRLIFFGVLDSYINHSYLTHDTSKTARRSCTRQSQHNPHKGLSSAWATPVAAFAPTFRLGDISIILELTLRLWGDVRVY